MGVVVYFAGYVVYLKGLRFYLFCTQVSKKFKKRLYKRGVLVYNQPRRTVLVHNFYQKRYLNGTRKEQYTP